MIITKNRTTVLKLQFKGNTYEDINSMVCNSISMWSSVRKQKAFVVNPNEQGFTTFPHHYQPHSNDYFFFIWSITETIFGGEYFLHRVTVSRGLT